MQRRQFVEKLTLGSLGVALQGCGATLRTNVLEPPSVPVPVPWQPPNIILVVFDDARLDDFEYLPHVQREMVDQGLTLSSAYNAVSLCTPSRVSILLGQYQHHHRIMNNDNRIQRPLGGFQGFYNQPYARETIATWLQRAGYRTILAGKFLNNYEGHPINPQPLPWGWDEVYVPVPSNQQFDFSLRINDGYEGYPGRRESGAYEADVIFDKVVRFIRATPTTQPFFAYINPVSPHNPPRRWAARFEGRFADLPFVPRPSFNDPDVRGTDSEGLPLLSRAQVQDIINVWRERLRTMLSPDEKLAELIATLRAVGRLNNTYIFVTSDNGWFLGEHRRESGKTSPYEESSHMPLFVRGPGIAPRTRLAHPVSLVDLAPTFLDLAHQQIPSSVDGVSLVPLLGQNPLLLTQWRPAVFFETIPWFEAIRWVRPPSDFVYTLVNGREELYNMELDPCQRENLVYRDRLPPEFALLQAELCRLAGRCR